MAWNMTDLARKINDAITEAGQQGVVCPARHPDYRVVIGRTTVVVHTEPHQHEEDPPNYSWAETRGEAGGEGTASQVGWQIARHWGTLPPKKTAPQRMKMTVKVCVLCGLAIVVGAVIVLAILYVAYAPYTHYC